MTVTKRGFRYVYFLESELSLPALANPKFKDLSFTEVTKRDCRVIGGDKGDLEFKGYELEDGKTFLYKPVVVTTLEGLTDDQVFDVANEILMFSYESIGAECVEHS